MENSEEHSPSCSQKPRQFKKKKKKKTEEAVALTDGLIGRCRLEVAALDDLGRQLTGGWVVDEPQEDLRQGGVLGGAVGQSSGTVWHTHQGAATLAEESYTTGFHGLQRTNPPSLLI